MTEWDHGDCLRRYRELETCRPELFAGRGEGAFRILAENAMIEQAKAEAGALRARQRMTHADLRVGVIADDPYAIAMREAVEFPDGTLGLYNRFIVPAGVVVMPLHGADIVVMYRFRHGTRSWHYEFPRGIVEPGDGNEAAVRRELQEEIGATASEIIDLGGIHTSSGITNEFDQAFLARLTVIGRPDPHEAVLRIEVISADAFRRKVATGAITDAPTLSAYALATARGQVG